MIVEFLRRILRFFLRDRRFYVYILIGGSAALINIASRYGLSSARLLPYEAALAVAYVLGLLWNFAWNKYANYKAHAQKTSLQFLRFSLVALGGLLLTLILAGSLRVLFLRWFAENRAALFAHVVAVGLVMLYSFAAHTKFTFRESV